MALKASAESAAAVAVLPPAGWVIFSLRGPLKESYQSDLDVTNPLLVAAPCLLMAIIAHPSTRHFILFRVRLSWRLALPCAGSSGRQAARGLCSRSEKQLAARACVQRPADERGSELTPHSGSSASMACQPRSPFCPRL